MCKDLLKLEIQETRREIFHTQKAKARAVLISKYITGSDFGLSYFDTKIEELKNKLTNLLNK